jgi:hypothetical protein
MNSRFKLVFLSAVTALSFAFAQAQTMSPYDPALNAGVVSFTTGKSVEVTLKPFARALLEGGSDIKIVSVLGAPGVTASLKSIKSASGGRAETKLEFKHEYFKGTGVGNFPVEVTLENAKTGYRLTFFVTLMLK